MNRQQRRACERKELKKKTATYNVTKSQLEDAVKATAKQELDAAYKSGFNDGITNAIELLLTLPLEVLKDHYWKKTYEKRLPEFAGHVLEYYERWQNGELDMDTLRAYLVRYGGVEVEVQDV